MYRLSLKYCDFPCSRKAKTRSFLNLQQHGAAMRKTARSYHELHRSERASCVCKRAIHLKSTKSSPSDAIMISEQKPNVHAYVSSLIHDRLPATTITDAIKPKFENCSCLRRKLLFPPMKKGRSRECLKTQLQTPSVNHCNITTCDSIDGVIVERYHKLQFV
ncbi:unnamed protein product [Ixodes persulcatus]